MGRTGLIFEIKEFGIYDGPGLRLTVFLKGCPLRCAWCHNPEGLELRMQVFRDESRCRRCGLCGEADGPYDPDICPENLVKIVGEEITAKALADRILRHSAFILDRGGVTFSGGEPLLQAEFLLETLALLPAGLHKAAETCGHAPAEIFREIAYAADLMYIDLKHMDNEAHRRLTGRGNGLILRNIEQLKRLGKPFIVRVPLIPGLTDTPENLGETAAFLSGSAGLLRVELLPYNLLTGAKYCSLGLPYRPDFDESRAVNADTAVIAARGIDCRVL